MVDGAKDAAGDAASYGSDKTDAMVDKAKDAAKDEAGSYGSK